MLLKGSRPYLSGWSWGRRWGSGWGRGRHRSPHQLLQPAEHGGAWCGLQPAGRPFPAWISDPWQSPEILHSPRLVSKQQTEAIQFLRGINSLRALPLASQFQERQLSSCGVVCLLANRHHNYEYKSVAGFILGENMIDYNQSRLEDRVFPSLLRQVCH